MWVVRTGGWRGDGVSDYTAVGVWGVVRTLWGGEGMGK